MAKLAVDESASTDINSSHSLSRHDLASDPFADVASSDEAYVDAFFMGGDRRAVLDEVVHLCQFSNNVVAVLGEAGVGKTALVQQAMAELSDTAECCLIQASVMADVEDVVRQVASQLGVFLPEDASVDQVIYLLSQYVPSGLQQRVVIIIDDAHHLGNPIFSAILSVLHSQSAYYLHVLLVGDSSLLVRLDELDKGEILVYDIPLCPFSVDELEQYLVFKLAAVGYQGAELFDYDAVQTIWRDTRGIPLSVNQAARNMLLSNESISGENEKPLGLPIWHMAALVVLLAGLIMAVFYVGDDVSPLDDEVAEVVPPSIPVSTEDASDLNTGLGNDKREENLVPVSLPSDDVTSLKVPPLKDDVSVVPDSSVLKNDAPSLNVGASSESSAEPKVSVFQEAAPPVSLEKAAPTSLPKVVEPKSTPKPKKPVVEAPTPVVTKVAPTKVSKVLTLDEEAVLLWDSESYTLQLLAARQLSGVKDFVAAQQNRNLLRIVSFDRGGEHWYAVIVGVYPTREEARSGVKSLPVGQSASNPWPRKVESIQQRIKDFRRK